jgi:hypothetical protein
VVANTSTAVVDSGASNIYFAKDAAICNFDSSTPKVNVGTATGQVQRSTGTSELNLLSFPDNFPTKGHVMPSFKHILLGIGKICDADCKVVFTKETVVVYNAQQQPILSGWRETTGPKLWRISLNPDKENLPSIPETATRSTLQAFSAYDIPSVEALVKYFHAAAGFPSKTHGSRPSRITTIHLGRASPTKMQGNTAHQRTRPSKGT